MLIGKRPLGKPRYRWKEIIIMDLKEIGINSRNWVYYARERDSWRVHLTFGFHKSRCYTYDARQKIFIVN